MPRDTVNNATRATARTTSSAWTARVAGIKVGKEVESEIVVFGSRGPRAITNPDGRSTGEAVNVEGEGEPGVFDGSPINESEARHAEVLFYGSRPFDGLIAINLSASNCTSRRAVVMLSTFAVGLASGVGLFGLAAVGTLFLVLTLWVIEGFETHVRTFLLSIQLGEGTSAKRAAVERLLRARAPRSSCARRATTSSPIWSVRARCSRPKRSRRRWRLSLRRRSPIEWKEEKKARRLRERRG